MENHLQAVREIMIREQLEELAEQGRAAARSSLYSRHGAMFRRAAIAVAVLLWALLINMCYRL